MNLQPFFTVVIPTFQQAHFIKTCLESVLDQSYKDFEVVVSDDSEDQETEKIITSFSDSRVRYYKNNPSLGRVQNYRVNILERAKGKWCLICDGDDFITDRNYLENVKNIIDESPSIVFLQAGHYKGSAIETAELEVPKIPNDSLKLNGYEYLMQFRQLAHFSHLSSVSNIEILRRLDPFRMPILSSDIETYLRLASHGDVYLLKKPVGLWRQHQNNASATSKISSLIRNLTWVTSVSSYWLRHCDSGMKKNIRTWEKEVKRDSIRFLFRKTLLSLDTRWRDISEFIYMTFKSGLAHYLLTSGQTYFLFFNFMRREKI